MRLTPGLVCDVGEESRELTLLHFEHSSGSEGAAAIGLRFGHRLEEGSVGV